MKTKTYVVKYNGGKTDYMQGVSVSEIRRRATMIHGGYDTIFPYFENSEKETIDLTRNKDETK